MKSRFGITLAPQLQVMTSPLLFLDIFGTLFKRIVILWGSCT